MSKTPAGEEDVVKHCLSKKVKTGTLILVSVRQLKILCPNVIVNSVRPITISSRAWSLSNRPVVTQFMN